jgi:hypothetical protein
MAALMVAALVAAVALPAQHAAQAAAKGSLTHIFVIMMENEGDAQIYGNTADAPYINALTAKYAVAQHYYGVTHPSLPNYLAALSGSFQGVWDDCKAGAAVTCAPQEFMSGSPYNGTLLTKAQIASATARPHLFGGQTLVDQLEAHKLTWKAYMESMPSVGYTGEYYPVDTVGGKKVPRKLYAEKHNPFMYFSSIVNNPARVQKVVPFTQFAGDLQSGRVPNFVWISPNQCSDMHSLSAANAKAVGMPACAAPKTGMYHSPIKVGDTFLKGLVGEIMASSAWATPSAIVIPWDENDYSGFSGCCHSPAGVGGVTLGGGDAPLIVILSQGAHHVADATPYNHYSLLATIEKLWGLGCLNETCKIGASGLMTQLFQ